MGVAVEIKEGYVKTKLGWVPSDWKILRLENVCGEFKSGFGITAKQITDFGRFPVYGGNGLRGYSSDFTHEGHYILIGRQGALCGNILEVNGKNYISEHAIAVNTNEDNDNSFLAFKLDFLKLNRLSESSAQPGLAVGKLLRFKLSLPPLPEQKKIADILSTWDKAIETTQALIERLQHRKKGLMQQLLTGNKRLPGFSGEWGEVYAGEIFEEIKKKNDGGSHEPLTISSKVGFVSQRKKFDKVIAGSSLSKYIQLQKFDFSYNKGNSKTYPMGCIFLLEEFESAVVPFVYISFTPLKELDKYFYKYWFENHGLDRQLKAIITSGARGDGLLNVSKKDFFKLLLPYPVLKEQTTIAQVLIKADEEIGQTQQYLEQMQEQKKGLMQQLLTGQKRVKV